ncbi:LysM peptidoglycan-binding domain-containing protein [Arcticibacterium luteifluviistationis]|uniref:Peptidoglycan-binding protein n=1 Tax=Arcticibacterium luteifluviistationis TaxID=1784714 RepID=A0A2Z4G6R9_9BACT|nr:LysM domain-containing protein [Arcticibacterium luteifluviistationis]AWV96848.1 peptidoglycan-binding protein [Arcticibacterium luteifluviistationis]
MEFEDRNKKPEEPAKNLPMAVLITLVGVVCLLLYVGWQMISDDASNVSDLTPQTSIITEPEEITAEDMVLEEDLVEDVAVAESTPSQPAPAAKEVEIPSGSKTGYHTIAKGETLFAIANKFNISLSTLQAANPNVTAQNLKEGSKLSVPVLAIHTVGPGDILRVVGGKYGVTVKAIMAANGKTKNYAARGEKLLIPFKDKQ